MSIQDILQFVILPAEQPLPQQHYYTILITHSVALLLVPLLIVAGDADIGAAGLLLHPELERSEFRGLRVNRSQLRSEVKPLSTPTQRPVLDRAHIDDWTIPVHCCVQEMRVIRL